MRAKWTASARCRHLRRIIALGTCALLLAGCSEQAANESASGRTAQAHRCAQVDGAKDGAQKGNAVCEAYALGGDGNKASADADGEGSSAGAVAGSLALFDKGRSDLSSDNNTSLAAATDGGGALARSGVNAEGKSGAVGNSAVARAERPDSFANASAANGSHNSATSVADGCVGTADNACAFSASGNGDHNVASADSGGRKSVAQAGALDGDFNKALSKSSSGGRASSSAQGGDGNSADSLATALAAFASSQATGGNSFALARAEGAKSTANAIARLAATARAFADLGATATATATGKGFTAYAYASGPGTTATATHDADTDTGSCSGPGVAYAMTGGTFRCVRGF